MTEPTPMKIARTLRERRIALRFKQRDLADLTGYSDRTVRRALVNPASVSFATVVDLLEAMGLSLEVSRED